MEPNTVFKLEPAEGVLYWIEPAKYRQRKGRPAGTIQETRGKHYIAIQVDGKKYKRSRIVFYMINGYWPTPTIDHINGNSLDDRPSNLRQATRLQNAWNRKIGKAGKLLPMGVLQNGKKYQANITVNYKRIHLGVFNTPEEAEEVYQAKRKEYYADFAS